MFKWGRRSHVYDKPKKKANIGKQMCYWYCPFSTPRTVCICRSATPLARKGALQPVLVILSNENAVELSIAPKWWFPTLIIWVYRHQGYGCSPRRVFEHGACLAIWQGTGAPHILHFAHLTVPLVVAIPRWRPRTDWAPIGTAEISKRCTYRIVIPAVRNSYIITCVSCTI